MFNTFSERIQLASTPVIIDREPEYEISQIVDSKIDCQQTCKLLYKVIWLGYEDTRDESEWIPTLELIYASDLVADFHIVYPTKPSSLSLSWSHCCTCLLPTSIFQQGFFFINFLVYSIHLFLLNPSFSVLFRIFCSKLSDFFSFYFLDFLTHTFRSQKKK